MTPAERAAAPSARIHREINAGRFVLGLPYSNPGCATAYFAFRSDGACTGCALGAAAFVLGLREPGRVFGFIGPLLGEAASQIEAGFEAYDNDIGDPNSSWYRLGAELRAIALGNREGAR